jgi:hypothetical protein
MWRHNQQSKILLRLLPHSSLLQLESDDDDDDEEEEVEAHVACTVLICMCQLQGQSGVELFTLFIKFITYPCRILI